MVLNRKQKTNLKFPQDSRDVGFIGKVGQDLQLQKSLRKFILMSNKLVVVKAQVKINKILSL